VDWRVLIEDLLGIEDLNGDLLRTEDLNEDFVGDWRIEWTIAFDPIVANRQSAITHQSNLQSSINHQSNNPTSSLNPQSPVTQSTIGVLYI
jgi:hypothetical protein